MTKVFTPIPGLFMALALVLAAIFVVKTRPVVAATTEYFVTDPRTGVAMYGYDMVAYFTKKQALLGAGEFEYEWGGTYWQFTSAANRDRFIEAPGTYIPRFNGYATRAMASGQLTNGNPLIWAIYQDELFFFHSLASRDAWVQSPSIDVQRARLNWAVLKKNLAH